MNVSWHCHASSVCLCNDLPVPGSKSALELTRPICESHKASSQCLRDPADALPKPVSAASVQYKPAKRDRQNPIIQQTPPAVTDSPPQTAAVPMQPQDNPFPAAAVPNQHQDPPLRDLDSARDEQPSETSVNFVAAAMSRMATQGVSGLGMGRQDTSRQDIGRQDSMLPSESRKLAHLALCAKEMPPKVPTSFGMPQNSRSPVNLITSMS